MYVQAYVNQPISPAERLFEESTRVPYFSAQLALLTARPPEQNPRLAQGCVTFWAEHDRGPERRLREEQKKNPMLMTAKFRRTTRIRLH